MENEKATKYEQADIKGIEAGLFFNLRQGEQELENAQAIEEETCYSDAMDSMERKYWEGYTEALEKALVIVRLFIKEGTK